MFKTTFILLLIQTSCFAEKTIAAEGIFKNALHILQNAKTAKDKELANKYFKIAGDKGFVPAINALADSYYSGDGIKQDYTKAKELYQKSADLGYMPSQFNLGIMYLKGYGIKQDFKKALQYLLMAYNNKTNSELKDFLYQYITIALNNIK